MKSSILSNENTKIRKFTLQNQTTQNRKKVLKILIRDTVLRIFLKLSLTTNSRNPHSDPKVLEPRSNPVLRYSEKDLLKSSTKSYRLSSSIFRSLVMMVDSPATAPKSVASRLSLTATQPLDRLAVQDLRSEHLKCQLEMTALLAVQKLLKFVKLHRPMTT